MQGLTLPSLAAEVERQSKTKRDFIAPASRIKFVQAGEEVGNVNSHTKLAMDGQDEPFKIRGLFHSQVEDHLKIPKPYYQRMLANAPVLLRRNVNHWLAQDTSTRLIRTLDGKARAFLSDRYRVLDNYDLCQSILPLFAKKGLKVISSEITESRMYIKAICPELTSEIKGLKIGDVVQGGVSVWNSETGCGTVGAESFIYTLACHNGMTVPMSGMRKHHLGRRYNGDDMSAREIFRDETREADDKAFFMKVQDVVADCVSEDRFGKIIAKINSAVTDNEILSPKGRPVEDVIEVTRKAFDITETEGASIMKHLVNGGDLSRWGVVSAVTRTAQDVDSYDRFDELQRIGGEILELPKSRWAEIALRN